jgi:SAM-dependent methyltransferase
MVSVSDQYEAFPYPERDPADERTRLITGSPSDPIEMDHYLFGGARDWSKPLRAMVAGGGTGDGLIQLATRLSRAGRPFEITYLDLSCASRAVAEKRADVRGLTGITFHTASLLDAPDFGEFDYIDCCGVLHHLSDPGAGFKALRAACAPTGGLGFMVYAPLGRSGVYPLQQAFGALFANHGPAERLAAARAIFAKLPSGHLFKTNPHLGDHKQSDAGFYDLLLHSQDRSYDVGELLDELTGAGWDLASFCQPGRYDLARFVEVPATMDAAQAMVIAEKLNGTMKVHLGYAVPAGAVRPVASAAKRSLVPHLRAATPAQLAKAVSTGNPFSIKSGGETIRIALPKSAAPLIVRINGKRSLNDIASGMDPITFGGIWSQIEAAFTPWDVLLYSRLLT